MMALYNSRTIDVVPSGNIWVLSSSWMVEKEFFEDGADVVFMEGLWSVWTGAEREWGP